jgi:hypothetical protein
MIIATALTILQWIFSIVCVCIFLSVISWPFLLNTTPFANMPYNMSNGITQERIQEIDNKLLSILYNDVFRFLLPTTAIIIVAGIVLLVLIGLISFVLLLISIMV